MGTHNVYEYIAKHQGCSINEIANALKLRKESVDNSILSLKQTITKKGNSFVYVKENKLYARKWEE